MYCKSYVGVACIDGSCPIAQRGDHELMSIPVLYKCEDCWMYKGCEDCALEGTEMCEKNNNQTKD